MTTEEKLAALEQLSAHLKRTEARAEKWAKRIDEARDMRQAAQQDVADVRANIARLRSEVRQELRDEA